MRFKFLLCLFLPASVFAQSLDLKYGAIGTAMAFSSDTKLSVSSTSSVTTFTSDTVPRVYRMVSTQDVHLNLTSPGVTGPTATASNMLLPAGLVEYYVMKPGTNLAFIRDSADGFLYIAKTTP